ncbi:MAG: adenylate/guanylate cyclase [Hyphomicrobium sp.]|nr:adenylate/guanylate cyclase [Hyphomicrobium sp.]
MTDEGWKAGLQQFLTVYCTAPGILREAMERIGLAPRINRLFDLEYLCRQGDVADCYWIVCEGHVRVERRGREIILRGAGELVGEQAFYRPMRGVSGSPTRGACLRAAGSAKLLRIDRSLVGAMTLEERAIWYETLARALCDKLDQATDQRQVLGSQQRGLDELIRRFVCAEGREAALAAIEDSGRIACQQTEAVLWFSDTEGFSRFATTQTPASVSEVIRLVMEIQSEEIAKAGGQIDKYMGDGLMAFWLCPDAPRAALACDAAALAGLAAVERVLKLFSDRSLPLGIRIGLHVGTAVFGDFGGANRIAFTCTGQAVNEASRYEQAITCEEGRPLGAVRISSVLWERIQSENVRDQFGPRRWFKDKHGNRFATHSVIG